MKSLHKDRQTVNILFCMVAIVILTISASGCWDRREPKSLAMVSSSLFDLTADGNYVLTIEVRNPAAQTSIQNGGKASNLTATSAGKSAPEAMRNLSRSMDKPIFGWHNKVRFFSDRLARSDVISVQDYLLRSHVSDEKPLMIIVADEDPKRIYSATLGLSDTVGDYFENMSQANPELSAKSVFVDVLAFIKDYYDDGKQPVAGVIYLVPQLSDTSDIETSDRQDPNNGANKVFTIKNEGLAVFKNDKLVGYMNGTETRAYNFIINKIKTAVVNIQSGGDSVIVAINKSKADVETTVEDNQTVVEIRVKISASILQEGGSKNINKTDLLKTVENSLNMQIAEEITNAVQKAQTEFHSDIYGFGTTMHTQHPDQWEQIKNHWDDHYFTNAVINVTVESSVDKTGSIKEPLRLEDGDG